MRRSRGKGEGTIYPSRDLKGKSRKDYTAEEYEKLPIKYWIGQYTDNNGKRHSIYGKTRVDVKEQLNKTLVSLDNNSYIYKQNITLAEIARKINTLKLKGNKVKSTSYYRNNYDILKIENSSLGKKAIQNITAEEINEYLCNFTYLSNSSINKIYLIIKQCFTYSQSHNIIQNNPFLKEDSIILPNSDKKDKEVIALTVEEQKKIVAELEKKYDIYSDILLIALYSGMRIGEILALREEDIDLKNNTILIKASLTKDENGNTIIGESTKTSIERVIPITPLLKDLLKNAKPNPVNKLLFYQPNGKIISASTINSHFKKIAKNANVKAITLPKRKHKEDEKIINLKSSSVNTHMLRHTYATRCIEAGMSTPVLSKLLGHKNIQITLNTYTSILDKYKKDEVDKYLEYMKNL